MAHTLLVDTLIFDTPTQVNEENLKMSANRYYTTGRSSESGVTLLLTHASGAHKEHWEPVLESLLPRMQDSSLPVREAWAFDWQSHGDSAVLNAGLFEYHKYIPTTADWGKAIAAFVKAFLLNQRIICIGHSVGAHAIMYSTTCFEDLSLVPYQSFILVEPAMIDKQLFNEDIEKRTRAINLGIQYITKMPSEWESRIVAAEFLLKRIPWSNWDARTRSIYLNKGLRQINTESVHPPRVATKCMRQHETVMYNDPGTNFENIEQITKLCPSVPFHIIFGERLDFWPQYCQDSVIDVAKGRKVASVTHIPGGGHLVVQEQPDRVADAIYQILTSGNVDNRTTSYL